MTKLQLDAHNEIDSAHVNKKVNEIVDWINEHDDKYQVSPEIRVGK